MESAKCSLLLLLLLFSFDSKYFTSCGQFKIAVTECHCPIHVYIIDYFTLLILLSLCCRHKQQVCENYLFFLFSPNSVTVTPIYNHDCKTYYSVSCTCSVSCTLDTIYSTIHVLQLMGLNPSSVQWRWLKKWLQRGGRYNLSMQAVPVNSCPKEEGIFSVPYVMCVIYAFIFRNDWLFFKRGVKVTHIFQPRLVQMILDTKPPRSLLAEPNSIASHTIARASQKCVNKAHTHSIKEDIVDWLIVISQSWWKWLVRWPQ